MTQGLLKITTGVAASEQESAFMNATLSTNQSCDVAVSIAVFPPNNGDFLSESDITEKIRNDFAPLIAKGWTVEVQTGPDRSSVADCNRTFLLFPPISN